MHGLLSPQDIKELIFQTKKILGYLSYLSLAIFRWLLGDSSNKFQGIEVLIDSFPIERFLISPHRLGIFSWNHDNTNKISLLTCWHPQVEIWNLMYVQTAISQYNSQPTRQVSHGKNQLLPFLEFPMIALTSQVDWWCH